ncbi:MAG: ABC transporter ATP-binding protein [Phycisphaerales bacterium]|nr:ABC transporter ATP-binding protein [Phycisphaerales bacterium]
MIAVDNLTKVFPTPDGRGKSAVHGVSFRVDKGEIYGLLGPNGAGKTTTLRIISGLMSPTSGSAVLSGYNVFDRPQEVKRSIGFLTANTGLYQRLSPRDILRYFAELHGMDRKRAIERSERLIEWLDMTDFADLRCGALSTGQRQRTNIGRALIADPPILIMDEPTLGLDVLSNRMILDFIRRERSVGKTIVLSTHYLDEAEGMCDRVGLLHNGRIIADGTLDELRKCAGTDRLSSIFLTLIHERQSVGFPAA